MYQRVIFCDCGGEAISENIKQQALDLLSGVSSEILKIRDLCGQCATNKDSISDLFLPNAKTLVIACHQRAVKLLLGYAGLNDYTQTIFLSLRESDAKASLEIIQDISLNRNNSQTLEEISSNSDWPAWYPVLDYSRCTGCGQCADFCLFGVYKKNNGTVEVLKPDACKNNCPACARICPHYAIVFPKYIQGGAISGSEKIDEQEEQERQKADMDAILGGDIYQALEMRKAKRQSIIKSEALNKANEERDKALKENLN